MTVTNGAGAFVVRQAGLAGEVSGSVAVNIPSVTFSAGLRLQLNTTGAVVNQTFLVAGVSTTLALPAGNYVQVATLVGQPATLSVLGQTLSAEFTIQKTTATVAGVVQNQVSVAITNLTLQIKDGATTFVNVTNGTGALLVTPAGVAASFNVSATLGAPGVFSVTGGTVAIEINTAALPVDETYKVGATDVTLKVPAGPFIRVAVVGAHVLIGNETAELVGDFFFDQATRTDGTKVTRVAGNNVAVTVAGQSLKNGAGAFVILPTGFAGFLAGDVAVATGSLEVGGSIGLRVNKTGVAVDETIILNGRTFAIQFPDGANTFSVFVAGLTIRVGDFVEIQGDNISFTQTGGVDSLIASGVSVFMGSGPVMLDGATRNPAAQGVLLSSARVGVQRFGTAGTYTYAVYAEGTLEVVGFSGFTFTGSATVRFNNVGADKTLSFPKADGANDTIAVPGGTVLAPTASFTGDLALAVAGQALSGTFGFSQSIVAGVKVTKIGVSNASLSVGDGTTEFLSVTNGTGGFIVKPTGLAGRFSAEVAVNPALGFSLSAGLAVEVNTTTATVADTVPVAGAITLPAGPYLRLAGAAITLTVSGQSLLANFALERFTKSDGTVLLRVGATNVQLHLKADPAGPDVASLTDGEGFFVVSSAGLAGRIGGTLAITIPGGAADFTGTFTLAINNTPVAVNESFVVAGKTISLVLPSGPYVRVEGMGVSLRVAGQVLGGDFAFEKVTTTGVGARSVIRVVIANARLSLGDGTNELVSLTNGDGAFIVETTGIAGTVGGTVRLNVPGVTFGGTFQVALNTTGTAVQETFNIGARAVTLNVPGGTGPYLRIAGTSVSLAVAGQTIGGDFAIEQLTKPNGERIARLAILNGSIDLGGGLVRVGNLAGAFIFTPAGVAGQIVAAAQLNVAGGLAFSGKVSVKVNNTPAAVSENFVVGAETVALALPAGPFVRVEVAQIDALTPATLTVLGQTLSGNFALERVTNPAGEVRVRIAVTNAKLSLGDGMTEFVSVTNGSGFFVLSPAGTAGTLSGTVGLNVPGVTFTGAFSVSLNNTAAAVDESIVVAGHSVRVELPAGPYLRVAASNVSLSVAGQVISGNFALEQVTRGPPGSASRMVRVAATNVSVVLGDGTTAFVSVTGGEGNFIILPTTSPGVSAIAGRIGGTAAINLPGVSLSAALIAEINQTGLPVNEQFAVGGTTTTLTLDGGKYVRIAGTGVALIVAGQTLRGDFTFTKNDVTQQVDVTVANVHLGLGDGMTEFVSADVASGSLTLKPAGVVANITGIAVTTNIPGVEFAGTLYRHRRYDEPCQPLSAPDRRRAHVEILGSFAGREFRFRAIHERHR